MANVRSTTTTRPCHLSPTGSRTKCRHRPPHALRRVDDNEEYVVTQSFYTRCDGVHGISHISRCMGPHGNKASHAYQAPKNTRLRAFMNRTWRNRPQMRTHFRRKKNSANRPGPRSFCSKHSLPRPYRAECGKALISPEVPAFCSSPLSSIYCRQTEHTA